MNRIISFLGNDPESRPIPFALSLISFMFMHTTPLLLVVMGSLLCLFTCKTGRKPALPAVKNFKKSIRDCWRKGNGKILQV
jgi:hypothetical protein